MLRLRTLGAFALAGVLALSTSILPAQSATLAPNDWSSAGRSSARTGYNRDGGLVATNVANMVTRWSVSGGKFSAPITVRNQIVVANNSVNGHSRLDAYNIATGTLNWSVDYGLSSGSTVGSPATDGARAFVMVERASGSLWRYALYAYDLTTGAKVWAVSLGTGPSRLGTRPVLTAGGYVFAQSTYQNAFRRTLKYSAGGVYQWTVQQPTSIRATAISGGALYHSTDTAILKYDVDTALFLGQVNVGATSLAISGDAIYYANSAVAGAFDKDSSFPLWTMPLSPSCGAYVRVVTTSVAAISRCATAAPYVVHSISGGVPSVPFQIGVGDVPIAASKQVMIAVTATGGLRAWNLLNGDSLVIKQPTAPARLSGQSGPVVGGGVIVVPENGRLEVIG